VTDRGEVHRVGLRGPVVREIKVNNFKPIGTPEFAIVLDPPLSLRGKTVKLVQGRILGGRAPGLPPTEGLLPNRSFFVSFRYMHDSCMSLNFLFIYLLYHFVHSVYTERKKRQ